MSVCDSSRRRRRHSLSWYITVRFPRLRVLTRVLRAGFLYDSSLSSSSELERRRCRSRRPAARPPVWDRVRPPLFGLLWDPELA